MTAKSKLDKLIADNYNYFSTVAGRIIQKKWSYKNKDELLHQTIIDVYDQLEKNISKFENILDDKQQFIKWFSKYMSNEMNLSKTNFNSTVRPKELLLGDNEYLENLHLYNELEIDKMILGMENCNQPTKDFITDFMNSGMDQQRAEKYLKLMNFKQALPSHEKLLFELHFEMGMGSRKIASMVTDKMTFIVNYQSINAMINKIKIKIKETTW